MSDLANYRHPRVVRRVIESLIPIVCPSEHAELDVVDGILHETEQGMAAMPPVVRVALVAGITTYDLAAIPLHGKRAHKLRGGKAHAYYDFWRKGLALQREFIKGIKGLIGMSYAEQPQVLEHIGYTPKQWIDKVHKRRLEVYSDDIAAHEKTIFEPDPIPLPSEVAKRVESSVQLSSKKEAS